MSVPNLYRPNKPVSPPHAAFLVIKLLHLLDVVDWKTLGLSIKILNEYSERHITPKS
jgi:hypothetical protein